jgi:hypothetical protein
MASREVVKQEIQVSPNKSGGFCSGQSIVEQPDVANSNHGGTEITEIPIKTSVFSVSPWWAKCSRFG